MKDRTQVVLALAVMLLLGVVIGQATSSPRAEAQQGPRQWRECFAASLWANDGARMASPGFQLRTVTLPPGWVPVGGTDPRAVVLCR